MLNANSAPFLVICGMDCWNIGTCCDTGVEVTGHQHFGMRFKNDLFNGRTLPYILCDWGMQTHILGIPYQYEDKILLAGSSANHTPPHGTLTATEGHMITSSHSVKKPPAAGTRTQGLLRSSACLTTRLCMPPWYIGLGMCPLYLPGGALLLQ